MGSEVSINKFFIFLAFFFSWTLAQAQFKSPLDSEEFKNLSSASKNLDNQFLPVLVKVNEFVS